MTSLDTHRLDALIEDALKRARIPGAAIAIIRGAVLLYAKGYGYRSLEPCLPMTPETLYPIGSTTKAITATLLAMLVEEGRLDWDAPVQTYLPDFHLGDQWISAHVTLRDLVCMRTGLPRHDFTWLGGRKIGRPALVRAMRYLPQSAGFREKWQYNNHSWVAAAYLAELVTGDEWESLVLERILRPLKMEKTQLYPPNTGNFTLSWHETERRELRLTRRYEATPIGPAGSVIYSTVLDMTKWASFNLGTGIASTLELLPQKQLAALHAPQAVTGGIRPAPTPNSNYGLGWFVDTFKGVTRVGHTGYLNDIQSEIALFPLDDVAVVSFINFGCPRICTQLNNLAFALISGRTPANDVADRLACYEAEVATNLKRLTVCPRVWGTASSQSPAAYAGWYCHPAYGDLEIRVDGDSMTLLLNEYVVPLAHWHYDVWASEGIDGLPIDGPHPFDRCGRISFETDIDGNVSALGLSLEVCVAPIRFRKNLPANGSRGLQTGAKRFGRSG
jgi:CubicO group peptidase (beta-lactamase class C family)